MSATVVKGMTKQGGSRNGKDGVNGGIIKGRAEDWRSLGRESKSVAVEMQGSIHSVIRASEHGVHRQSQGSKPKVPNPPGSATYNGSFTPYFLHLSSPSLPITMRAPREAKALFRKAFCKHGFLD